jgi:hypothetical protein
MQVVKAAVEAQAAEVLANPSLPMQQGLREHKYVCMCMFTYKFVWGMPLR